MKEITVRKKALCVIYGVLIVNICVFLVYLCKGKVIIIEFMLPLWQGQTIRHNLVLFQSRLITKFG